VTAIRPWKEAVAMNVEWELVRSGPASGDHGVLLLPGGSCSARSYGAVMAQPALAGTRLVAATLPGHAGTAPPEDFSVESYARLAAKLAAENGCDVVVGFSMGATVAFEMAASGIFCWASASPRGTNRPSSVQSSGPEPFWAGCRRRR
jgi:pimeloyl-ACP methyl ester carboxylesterase